MMSSSALFARRRQRGATAPELAIVAAIFFVMLFGTFEVARALYLWATLAEATGRAARIASFTFPRNEEEARQRAMFSDGSGQLPLSAGITASHLHIDYLAADRQTEVTAPPPCPVQNIINCTNDPLGATCIRYVRARLCKPGTACVPVNFKPLISIVPLQVAMPTFETVAPAESLGLPASCS